MGAFLLPQDSRRQGGGGVSHAFLESGLETRECLCPLNVEGPFAENAESVTCLSGSATFRSENVECGI